MDDLEEMKCYNLASFLTNVPTHVVHWPVRVKGEVVDAQFYDAPACGIELDHVNKIVWIV